MICQYFPEDLYSVLGDWIVFDARNTIDPGKMVIFHQMKHQPFEGITFIKADLDRTLRPGITVDQKNRCSILSGAVNDLILDLVVFDGS
mgnify:FL=1